MIMNKVSADDALETVCGSDVSLVRLIERICTVEHFEEIGQDILPALAMAVDAHGALFRHVLGVKPSEIVLWRGAGYDLPRDSLSYLQNHFAQLEPLVRLAPTTPGSRDVFRPREMFDHSELDHDPNFRHFMDALSVHDAVCARVEHDEGDRFFFCFHRPASSRMFSKLELSRLKLLLAPLQSTLSRLRLKEQLNELMMKGSSSVGRLVLMVLDETLQPIYVHAKGRSVLSCLNRSSRFQTQLCEVEDADHVGTDTNSKLVSFENETFLVRRMAHRQSAHFVVYGGEGDASSLANLTKREHEIVADLCKGLSNKEIARHRNISVNTVQNHLRSIFGKLGHNSRTKLILDLQSADFGARLRANSAGASSSEIEATAAC
jgi:DNA-binding CsgD family transcriptional regulator